MNLTSLDWLIPCPAFCQLQDGVFSRFHGKVDAAPRFDQVAGELRKTLAVLTYATAEDKGNSPAYRLVADSTLKPEAWEMTVATETVTLRAATPVAMRYAVEALSKLLYIALGGGIEGAALQCGELHDAPRFTYRGFMIDSSRHLQTLDTLKALIRELAAARINYLHWHLVNCQGWRIESRIMPQAASASGECRGWYTVTELREIADYARQFGMEIIPELDVPGHSQEVLSALPQFNCDPATPGAEFCLGNPGSLELIKKLLDEVMEIFPDSQYIHLGGDEAETAHWDHCPRCQAAMRQKGFSNIRELEHDFMHQLTRHILARGHSPMIFGTGSNLYYPPDTLVQEALQFREPINIAAHGAKCVYCIHHSLYFDYPNSLYEPHESWMFFVNSQSIYLTDPYMTWPDQVKDSVIGVEALLWTEQVPDYRVLPKVLPRLAAYSECAWSAPERKSWPDFTRRRLQLGASGYPRLGVQTAL